MRAGEGGMEGGDVGLPRFQCFVSTERRTANSIRCRACSIPIGARFSLNANPLSAGRPGPRGGTVARPSRHRGGRFNRGDIVAPAAAASSRAAAV